MPSKTRVLFVAWAPFFSGAERALLLTITALDPSRYEPVVMAGTEGDFLAHVKALGITCGSFTFSQLERRHPISSAMAIAKVIRIARQYGVSLVHANETASYRVAAQAARFLSVPAVTHVRFPDVAAGFRWFFRTPPSRAFFVSQALLTDAMSEAPDVFRGRSAVLHDCVEPQPVWSAEEIAACRRELGLPHDVPVVAITGQVAEVKGIWDFVDAAALMRDARVHFAVLGDDLRTRGAVRAEMESRVRAHGLEHTFTFLGFRNDAPRVVQAFDIIAVPSHVEPLGNATLEAMAAGRPVVGSRVGGIPEMIVDGDTGFLTPPRDPAALAGALTRLVNDTGLRARMSAAARRRSLDAFGAASHAGALHEAYDSLCASRRMPVGAASRLA